MKLAIQSLLLFPFIFLSHQALATYTNCTKIIASGNSEYPPYLWRDADSDRLNGAVSYLINDLSKDLGIEIALIYGGPWGRVQEEAVSGRVDMIAGAFFTMPRTQYMDYVYPDFQATRTAIWFNQDNPFAFSEWNDLKAYQGITVINNSFGEEFDNFAKAQLHIGQVASLEQALQMLSAKRAEYLIYEEDPGHAYAKKMGITNLETQSVSVTEESLYLTLSKKSECNSDLLRSKISELLEKYRQEDRMDAYLNKAMILWSNQPS